MIKRAPRQPRHRQRLAPTFQPTVPALTWTMSIVAAKLRVTVTSPYTYGGVLPKITVQGALATAITQVSSTVFDLTYASSVVTTNVVVVPANDPGIRSMTGGFLNAGTVTL